MDKQFTAKQAARYLGISYAALARQRQRGSGVPFRRSGNGEIIYYQSDLDAYKRGDDVSSAINILIAKRKRLTDNQVETLASILTSREVAA